MKLHVLAGPNFSGRTARLRIWVGLPEDPSIEPVYSESAYIGPDPSSALSGIAPTAAAEIELMAAESTAAHEAKQAMELLGFGYCLERNPFTLSGGEQVVTVILAATASRPRRLAIDSAFEQLSPATRQAVLDYLSDLDGELMVADNRLDEWFDGMAEHLSAAPDAPMVRLGAPLTLTRDPCTIELVNLCHSYVKGRPVLKNLNLKLEAGGHYVLRGPNGCGKTTLSKILCGLIRPTSGMILVNGQAVQPWLSPGRYVSYHFQNPDYQLFANTVRTQFGVSGFDDLVHYFGLETVLDTHPLDLPYVLKKRVTVAAAFARKTGAVILDEPTIGQDRTFAASLSNRDKGATCIIVSHSKAFDSCRVIDLSL